MAVERQLYVVLVKDLSLDPSECLHIIGLWLWLSSTTIMENMLSLPLFLINELADEAVKCLRCLDPQCPEPRFRFYAERSETQLTRDLLSNGVTLWYLLRKRSTTFHEVQNLVSSICIPMLTDLFERYRHGEFRDSPAGSQMMPPVRPECKIREGMIPGWNVAMDRTLFVTFTRGLELVGFVEQTFVCLVEMVFLQRVSHGEQLLYARVLLDEPVNYIVGDDNRAKDSMNGKDVWVYRCVESRAVNEPSFFSSIRLGSFTTLVERNALD